MTFKFILCDTSEVTSAFDVRPVNYPTPSSSVVITGDPIFYTESPQSIDIVPNIYKVQLNRLSNNDWYLSGSNATASANIISGSYLSQSVATVLFDFADSVHTLGTVKSVTITPASKNVGWQDYFVLQDSVQYTTDDNGSITLDLVPQSYNVKYVGTKKNTSFSIVASGSCTASAIMATTIKVANTITPANQAAYAYTAQVSDARYVRGTNGTASLSVSSSYSEFADTSTSASYADFALSASYEVITELSSSHADFADTASHLLPTAGASWSTGSAPMDNNIAVAYGNGIFVGVRQNSQFTSSYSQDGVNWSTSSNTNFTHFSYGAVTYGNGMFVALGEEANASLYSTNGIDWNASAAVLGRFYSVAYGNKRFVAVGLSGKYAISYDGITWSTGTLLNPSITYRDITYANGLFVAVGAVGAVGGTSAIVTSPDGINWTGRTVSSIGNLYAITYGDGKFIAVNGGYPTLSIATSSDGITWSTTSLGTATLESITHIAYGAGLFVISSDRATYVRTSPDGVNWTTRTVSDADQYWTNNTFGNGRFVGLSLTGKTRWSGVLNSITQATYNVYGSASYANAWDSSSLLTLVGTKTNATNSLMTGSATLNGDFNLYGTLYVSNVFATNLGGSEAAFDVITAIDGFTGSLLGNVQGTASWATTAQSSGNKFQLGTLRASEINILPTYNDDVEISEGCIVHPGGFQYSASTDMGSSRIAMYQGNIYLQGLVAPSGSVIAWPDSRSLLLTNTGNVGIGTLTPVNKLDVVGNISCSVITASLLRGTALTASNLMTIGKMYFATASNTTVAEIWHEAYPNSPVAKILYITSPGNGGYIYFGKSGYVTIYEMNFSNVSNWRGVPAILSQQKWANADASILKSSGSNYILWTNGTGGNGAGWITGLARGVDGYCATAFKCFASDSHTYKRTSGGFIFTMASGSSGWSYPHTSWNVNNNDANSIMKLSMDGQLSCSVISASAFNGNPYANAYAYNTSKTITVGATDTPYRVTGLTGSYMEGFVLNTSNQQLTSSGVSGKYKVDWSIAAYCGTANNEIECGIDVNNTYFTASTTHTNLASPNQPQQLGGNAICHLNPGDAVGLRLGNHTGTNDITVEHINLTLQRVGG